MIEYALTMKVDKSMKNYKIADHLVQITGEVDYIPPEFKLFETEEIEDIEIFWEIHFGNPFQTEGKKPFIQNEYIHLYQEEQLWMVYPFYPYLLQMSVTPDASRGVLFLSFSSNPESKEEVYGGILYALRDAFFQRVQLKNQIAVHSSTILYRNRAYLFSAPSGTGKTTHTDMWEEQYHIEILDGDVCVLSMEENQVYAYGLPWCGTSGKFQNKKAEVGGIVFLRQNCQNQIVKLNEFESIIRLTARCLTPNWTQEQMDRNLKMAEAITNSLPCYLFMNRKEWQAVALIKAKFDEQT